MLNDIVKCAQSKEDLDPKYPSPDLKKRGEAIKQVYEFWFVCAPNLLSDLLDDKIKI